MKKINPELNKKDYKPTEMMKAPSNHEKLAAEMEETIAAILYNENYPEEIRNNKAVNKERKKYEK